MPLWWYLADTQDEPELNSEIIERLLYMSRDATFLIKHPAEASRLAKRLEFSADIIANHVYDDPYFLHRDIKRHEFYASIAYACTYLWHLYGDPWLRGVDFYYSSKVIDRKHRLIDEISRRFHTSKCFFITRFWSKLDAEEEHRQIQEDIAQRKLLNNLNPPSSEQAE